MEIKTHIYELLVDREDDRSQINSWPFVSFGRAKHMYINDSGSIHPPVRRVGCWQKSALKITPTLGNL